jgi:alcohol dehydrogenase class IV
LLNAVLLPHFMAFWLESCQERYACIAEHFGAPPSPREAVSQVVALTRWLKFPSLAEIGVKAQDLPKLAALAAANVSNPSNPTPMTEADYLGILEMAMTGQI